MIVFEPWVGTSYEQGLQGVKLLVLGESHYVQEGDELSGFTRLVINKHAVGPKRHPFFTKTAKMVLDRDNLPDSIRIDFWQRVAFYNYIQASVGNGPRQRPTHEMWGQSQAAFERVLADLQPDGVIVLGKQLGNHLGLFRDSGTVPVEIPSSTGRTLAVNTTHPSAPGFRYAVEKPKVEGLMSAIRQDRHYANA